VDLGVFSLIINLSNTKKHNRGEADPLPYLSTYGRFVICKNQDRWGVFSQEKR
jgi:hypothetical protein